MLLLKLPSVCKLALLLLLMMSAPFAKLGTSCLNAFGKCLECES